MRFFSCDIPVSSQIVSKSLAEMLMAFFLINPILCMQVLAAEVLGLRNQKKDMLLKVTYLKKLICQWGRSSMVTADMSALWKVPVCP